VENKNAIVASCWTYFTTIKAIKSIVLLMMGEFVTEKCKDIAENKNAIVASCWTYFTPIMAIYSIVFLMMGENVTRNI